VCICFTDDKKEESFKELTRVSRCWTTPRDVQTFNIMGLSYNEKRYLKKAGKWLWRLFQKERKKKKAAKFTDHVPSSSLDPALPRTVQEFLSLRDRIATTPEGGATCFIMALINYANPLNHDEGVSMAILSMAEENVVPSQEPGSYNGYGLHRSDIDRLNRASQKTANSYVAGTSPENDYTIQNPNSCSIGFRAQDKSAGSVAEGTKKVFVWSSGADAARPITMKRNVNGIWKAFEFSSLVVEVRSPASANLPAEYAAHAL
jgi:hypothetical protein